MSAEAFVEPLLSLCWKPLLTFDSSCFGKKCGHLIATKNLKISNIAEVSLVASVVNNVSDA